ncbi:MAG: hypothetical protein JWO11_2236, partial [Nocardioides sp.]|nr:hypothetical protein [Nocardioides sp.]
VTRVSVRRRRLYAVGGTVLGTAAVITAIALASNQDKPSANDLGPAKSPSGAVDPTSTDPAPTTTTVASYYLGDTPGGPKLFREFRAVETDDEVAGALQLLMTPPVDPDYSTPWHPGSFSDASLGGGSVTQSDPEVMYVTLADAALHGRPAGMSDQQAEMAIQQVVYTLQAAVQERAAVQFMFNGNPIDQVLGVPTSEPLTNASPLATLSHVSISDPAENATVSGSFDASGAANSFEANLLWEIRQGDQVVSSGNFGADGWAADKLFAWEGTVDVRGLTPGTYTFAISEDDPSGGAEGNGPDSDTRTIVVQ